MPGKMKTSLVQAKAMVQNFYGHRPKLRGWIHAVTTPLSVAASLVMLCLAPNYPVAFGCAVFLVCSLLLFGLSAIYHLTKWKSRQAFNIMRRIDHCNIFLLIAGSYTPIAIALLPAATARNLLIMVWSGAFMGVLQAIFWPQAPRWFIVTIYIFLGWLAVWYWMPLYTNGGAVVMWLLVAGGLCYSGGAIFYALRWPGRRATWFGFHEIFHAGTVGGWTCICIAAYFSVLNPNAGTF